MAIDRNYKRYGTDVFHHTNLKAFLSAPIRAGIHSISYGSTLVDFRFVDGDSDATIVLFHAAIDHSTVTLPFFSGTNLTEGLDANLLFISDPLVDLGTNIGWFTGNAERPLQTDLISIIDHARGPGPLIFFGSSAGGFAALWYSHSFPDSLAVASNPQTDIAKFYDDHIQNYLNAAWLGTSLESIPVSTSVLPMYSVSFPNYVAYIQNRDDTLHVTKHMMPFFEVTERFHSHRHAILGDWGDGHTPAPAPYLHGVLAWALECNGNWTKYFADEEFNS